MEYFLREFRRNQINISKQNSEISFMQVILSKIVSQKRQSTMIRFSSEFHYRLLTKELVNPTKVILLRF